MAHSAERQFYVIEPPALVPFNKMEIILYISDTHIFSGAELTLNMIMPESFRLIVSSFVTSHRNLNLINICIQIFNNYFSKSVRMNCQL